MHVDTIISFNGMNEVFCTRSYESFLIKDLLTMSKTGFLPFHILLLVLHIWFIITLKCNCIWKRIYYDANCSFFLFLMLIPTFELDQRLMMRWDGLLQARFFTCFQISYENRRMILLVKVTTIS